MVSTFQTKIVEIVNIVVIWKKNLVLRFLCAKI